MLPNFLVIGAPKAATTSLCELLGQHPELFMCRPKEPHFFSQDAMYDRGIAWYEALFEGARGCKAVGEGSTSYSMTGTWPNTVARIVHHLGQPKIIYSVREPFARAESGWMQSRHSANPVALPSFCRSLRESPNFLDESLYWKQISAYRRFIPDERILVLFFEDFAKDPLGVVRRCFAFLDVDTSFQPVDVDRPRKATANSASDRWLLRTLRRAPLFDEFRRRTPARVRASMAHLFRRPLGGRPQWDDQTRRWFADQIAEDIAQFLDFYGKPPDFWRVSEAIGGAGSPEA